MLILYVTVTFLYTVKTDLSKKGEETDNLKITNTIFAIFKTLLARTIPI